jgi:hypothetical protein
MLQKIQFFVWVKGARHGANKGRGTYNSNIDVRNVTKIMIKLYQHHKIGSQNCRR